MLSRSAPPLSHSRPQTRLEAAAKALECSWIADLSVESRNLENCSSEFEPEIQLKTEVDDDVDEMQTAGELKSEGTAVASFCGGTWNVGQRADSGQSVTSISAEERCDGEVEG